VGTYSGSDSCLRWSLQTSRNYPGKGQHPHDLHGVRAWKTRNPDFVVEAVIASAATGKPVKVVWTREEDIKSDRFRAATCQRIEAGLDARAS